MTAVKPIRNERDYRKALQHDSETPRGAGDPRGDLDPPPAPSGRCARGADWIAGGTQARAERFTHSSVGSRRECQNLRTWISEPAIAKTSR